MTDTQTNRRVEDARERVEMFIDFDYADPQDALDDYESAIRADERARAEALAEAAQEILEESGECIIRESWSQRGPDEVCDKHGWITPCPHATARAALAEYREAS